MAIVVAVSAAPAQAATLSRAGDALVYQAGAGEVNRPDFFVRDAVLRLTDGSLVITPGAGCAHDVEWKRPACSTDGITKLVLRLEDGNDAMNCCHADLTFDTPRAIRLEAFGGAGNDFLMGTENPDTLRGGPGDDKVWGSGGRDSLFGDAGADELTGFGLLDGASGNDTLHAFYPSGKKAYSTRIRGGAGKDSVNAYNQVRDVIDCGKGPDRAVADSRKDREKGCES